MKTTCLLCGSYFDCGAAGSIKTVCWCEKKPTLIFDKNRKACLCEACFDRALIAKESKRTQCFRLHLSYLGTDFSGIQEQSNARTVAGELLRAFKLITDQEVKIRVAGRTDAGVHARGQVLSLEFATRLSTENLQLALASKLPNPDVAEIMAY